MISYAEAVERIRGVDLALGVERLPLAACGGRRLAADLTARVPSPPYTNSAMDGFACRMADLGGGPLTVLGTIFARPLAPAELPAHRTGACMRIMTGGYLPEWADVVVPVEHSRVQPDGRVVLTGSFALGDNIRRRGSDLDEGALVLKEGTRLLPERLMVAAAFGHGELPVRELPSLAIFSTGDELAEPGTPLAPGSLYNSSKYFLLAAADALGLTPAPHRVLPDDEGVAERAVRALLDSGKPAVLITTGAVSAGEADFLPKIGARLGFTALFHRVAIRPGKPAYFAVKDRVAWLGLPGNAISTCVGWHAFALPLLAAAAGVSVPAKRTLTLMNEVRKPEALRCFFRAEVSGDKAWVAPRQGSAELGASITNGAYVELPEGFARIPAETRVEAIPVSPS